MKIGVEFEPVAAIYVEVPRFGLFCLQSVGYHARDEIIELSGFDVKRAGPSFGASVGNPE